MAGYRQANYQDSGAIDMLRSQHYNYSKYRTFFSSLVYSIFPLIKEMEQLFNLRK